MKHTVTHTEGLSSQIRLQGSDGTCLFLCTVELYSRCWDENAVFTVSHILCLFQVTSLYVWLCSAPVETNDYKVLILLTAQTAFVVLTSLDMQASSFVKAKGSWLWTKTKIQFHYTLLIFVTLFPHIWLQPSVTENQNPDATANSHESLSCAAVCISYIILTVPLLSKISTNIILTF